MPGSPRFDDYFHRLTTLARPQRDTFMFVHILVVSPSLAPLRTSHLPGRLRENASKLQ
jgi:hypothetical protein